MGEKHGWGVDSDGREARGGVLTPMGGKHGVGCDAPGSSSTGMGNLRPVYVIQSMSIWDAVSGRLHSDSWVAPISLRCVNGSYLVALGGRLLAGGEDYFPGPRIPGPGPTPASAGSTQNLRRQAMLVHHQPQMLGQQY